MLEIFIFLDIFLTLFMPFILGIILSVIVILLIRKKLVNKNKKFKVLIYLVIILVCGYVCVKGGYSLLLYASAKPDKVYIEMNEINDNKSLIGLSKEQVIELLGEPYRKRDDVYYYDAGTVTNYLFFGERDFYTLNVVFNENHIVEFVSIEMDT